jgi:hypothetical protein
MPLFIGLHTLRQDMGDGWHGYKEACRGLGIRAVCSYGSADKGVAWCVTEAPSAETVRQAHARSHVPVDEVFEVGYSD